jgi:hypothetical protein
LRPKYAIFASNPGIGARGAWLVWVGSTCSGRETSDPDEQTKIYGSIGLLLGAEELRSLARMGIGVAKTKSRR